MLAFLGNALIFLLMGVQIHPFARQLLAGPALTTWLVVLVAIGVVFLARFVLVLVLTAPFVGEAATQRWTTHPGTARQAATAARLAVDRVLERAAWGALARPGARVAAGRAFARDAGGVYLCRGPVHVAHPGVEYPLGLATHTLFPTANPDW